MEKSISQCRFCYLPNQKKQPKTGNWNSLCSLTMPELIKEKAPGAANTQGEVLEFCKCFDTFDAGFPEQLS